LRSLCFTAIFDLFVSFWDPVFHHPFFHFFFFLDKEMAMSTAWLLLLSDPLFEIPYADLIPQFPLIHLL